MSENSVPVSNLGGEPELNWKEISDALERVFSNAEHMKQLGMQVSSVGRATLISALHLHLIEVGGDPFKAISQMVSFLYANAIDVCNRLRSGLSEALKEGKVQGQKLKEHEREEMQNLLINLEMVLSRPHSMNADEIAAVLEAQKALTESAEKVAKNSNPLAVARALITMAQQFMFFDMEGDLVAARAAFMDQQQLLWHLAVVNVRNLIDAALKKSEQGAPEDKAN